MDLSLHSSSSTKVMANSAVDIPLTLEVCDHSYDLARLSITDIRKSLGSV